MTANPPNPFISASKSDLSLVSKLVGTQNKSSKSKQKSQLPEKQSLTDLLTSLGVSKDDMPKPQELIVMCVKALDGDEEEEKKEDKKSDVGDALDEFEKMFKPIVPMEVDQPPQKSAGYRSKSKRQGDSKMRAENDDLKVKVSGGVEFNEE